MLMEPDEYTPQERALTDKAKELIEQHELDWATGNASSNATPAAANCT